MGCGIRQELSESFFFTVSKYHFRPVTQHINTLTISQNKSRLAVGGYAITHLFDITSTSGNPLSTLEGHTGNVLQIDYEPNQKWMYTASEDRTVRIWDTGTLKCVKELHHPNGVNAAVLHPQGSSEMVTGDMAGNIRLWSLKTNAVTMHKSLYDEQSGVRSLSFTKDGKYLAVVSNKGDLRVFEVKADAERLHEVVSTRVHPPYCLKATFSPDGRHIATAGSDGSAKTWIFNPDAGEGEEVIAPVFDIKAHSKWTWDCQFSADGAYLVTCSADRTAKLWDLTAPPPDGCAIKQYTGHTKAVTCLALRDEAPE